MLITFLRKVWRRSGLKSIYVSYKFHRQISSWRRARESGRISGQGLPVIVLVPPDPLLFNASTGDMAMISVVMNYCRETWAEARFVVLTAGDVADEKVRQAGAIPCRVLDGRLSLTVAVTRIVSHEPTHCVTIGADVLDGSYDPVFSSLLLVITDMLARRGVRCVVTGFSVSAKPYPGLRAVFDEACHDIVFNLRDPVSYERFGRLSSARCAVVADVAFLLKPQKDSALVRSVGDWVDAQRAQGRRILGVNIHPLLLELVDRQNIDKVVRNLAALLIELVEKESLSLMLVEHDFRGASADAHCLAPLHNMLKPRVGEHLFFSKDRLDAKEIKAAVSMFDGVISGRMHLMIASLGVGVPVFGIEYKGKMLGLLNHVGLNAKSLTTAYEIISDPLAVRQKLSVFLEELDTTRSAVVAKGPVLKAMSSLNFAGLTNEYLNPGPSSSGGIQSAV